MSHRWESGFTVREPAWHRLGTVLPDWPGSWEAARPAAGLDWDVETEPVFTEAGLEVPGWQLLTRDDRDKDDTTRTLSVQSSSYAVISNGELGEMIQYCLDSDEHAIRYDTAGSLYGGRMVFATVYFDKPLTIPGDSLTETYTWVAFLTRHDGQGGARAFPTNVRIVCWNTASMADVQAKRENVGVTIRHSRNWSDRVNEMRSIIQTARDSGKIWEELSAKLVEKPVTAAQARKYFAGLFPISDDMSDTEKRNRTVARSEVYANLAGETCRGVDKTAYGLLMAATEYLDHGRRRVSKSSYVSRTLLRSEPSKRKAITLAKKLAGV